MINTSIKSQIDSMKIKTSWYGRITPFSIYTGPGLLNDRINQNIEFGRSFNVIDIGLVYGRVSQRKDSTQFLEAKITMDACQYSIFSNEFSIGAGYVFNSNTPIMLDISSTIFAQFGKIWGIGIVTGYYDLSGDVYGYNKNYFGLFVRFGLLRSEGGLLINRKPRMHHHR